MKLQALIYVDGVELGPLSDTCGVVRSEHVRGGHVDDASHAGVGCGFEQTLEHRRDGATVAELVGRRPCLGAHVDDLDTGHRVAQALVVRVGTQRDDRNFGSQRMGDVVAEKLAGTDD